MSTIRVDDGDSNLFTNGGWVQQQYGPLAYQGTISWSNTAGNSKVARFVGTSITVSGGLQPIRGSHNQALVIQFTIDGGQPFTYSPADPPDFQYVTYYQSPQLPLGEHVLTMVNMVSNDICLLDGFTIQANGGTAQILKSDGSATPRSSSPSTSAGASSSHPSTPQSSVPTSVAPVTVTIQPSTTNSIPSSQTTPLPSGSGSSSLPDQSSVQSASSSTFSASVYQPTTINANDDTSNQGHKGSNQIPMIIAVATSLLLFVLIVGILLFFLRKRRRRRQISANEKRQMLAADPYTPQPFHQPSDREESLATFKPVVPLNTSYGSHRNSAVTLSTASTFSAPFSQHQPSANEKRHYGDEGRPPASTNDEAMLPPYVA
ncbi:hypothetical protein BJ165DRAFT_1529732 [Panaeolus papilionaceus]|nr:hypothetical protein BJ165DRAFT_1529732 [Panaeolus papilionaceus]